MKISVEVEISADEIPLATELFAVLHKISSSIRPKNTSRLFMDLLSKIEDPAQQESVYYSIEKLYETTSEDHRNDLVEDFTNGFVQIALSSDLVAKGLSVQPYAILITRLSHSFKLRVREKLVPKMIKFLAVPHSPNVNRIHIFPYAEAFAYFIKLGLISMTGAMTTMINLLRNESTRAAGITMLGKSIELCLFEIRSNCPPAYLTELEETLGEIHEEAFQYDVSYIRENIHVTVTTPAPTGPPPPLPGHVSPPEVPNGPHSRLSGSPPPLVSSLSQSQDPRQNLHPTRSFFVHKEKIFAICYDVNRDNVITSSKDGAVTLWTANGAPVTRTEIPGYYASGIDMNPKTGMVVIAAKEANESQQNPVAFVHDLKGPKEDLIFSLKDSVRKKDIKQISAVKVFTHQNMFVLGESSPKQKRHTICLYNVGTTVSALSGFEEHEDLVTGFCGSTEHETTFFSASRDCTVRLWDTRKPQSAGLFGITSKELSGGLAPRPAGHSTGLSAVDSLGHLLITADQKDTVLAWDARFGGSSPPLARFTVLGVQKLTLISTRFAVAALSQGLCILNLETGHVTQVARFPDGRPNDGYNDLRWNKDKSVLYAAGGEGKLDVYVLS